MTSSSLPGRLSLWIRRRLGAADDASAVEVLRSDKVRAFALLVVIMLLLAAEKLRFTAHAVGTLPDGGYYMNIASHVRKGEGFISDLSLSMKGAPTLPYPTDMYPLWPLLYGTLARWFPLEPTGHWLPAILYFLALGFGYLWGRRLFPGPFFPGALPGFNGGHLLVLMLGLDSEFFRYTSYPYTEGLTYAVVLAGLWRAHSRFQRPSFFSGVEIGVWIGLATLSRKQMFLLALAACAVLLGAVLFSADNRKKYAATLAGASAAFATVCAPDWYWKSKLFPDMSLQRFLRWDQNQHTHVLAQVRMIREASGPWSYLRDRAAGFEIAFGTGRMSYSAHDYTFQYAVVVAALFVLAVAWRRRRDLVHDLFQRIWTRDALPATYAVVVGLAGFLSIQTMHMYTEASWEWPFAGRHALSSMFLFFLALATLIGTGRFPWKAAGTFVLCSGTWLGYRKIDDMREQVLRDRAPAPSAFTRWINAEKRARGKLIVAARQPQTFAHLTPGVGYHWYHDHATFSDVCGMTSKLQVDYVVVGGGGPTFAHDRRFGHAFRLVRTIGGARIYAATPSGGCARSTGAP